jgi:hypothetical protein
MHQPPLPAAAAPCCPPASRPPPAAHRPPPPHHLSHAPCTHSCRLMGGCHYRCPPPAARCPLPTARCLPSAALRTATPPPPPGGQRCWNGEHREWGGGVPAAQARKDAAIPVVTQFFTHLHQRCVSGGGPHEAHSNKLHHSTSHCKVQKNYTGCR